MTMDEKQQNGGFELKKYEKVFASFDPVALDLACAEAVMRQPIVPGSELHKANRPGMDHFTATSPNSSWRSQIEHGKKIGLGQDSYELITV